MSTVKFANYRSSDDLSAEFGGINIFPRKNKDGHFMASKTLTADGKFSKVGAVSKKVSELLNKGEFSTDKVEGCDVIITKDDGSTVTIPTLKLSATSRAVASF